MSHKKQPHGILGTNPYEWYRWVFDQFNFVPAKSRILELGCGGGEIWISNLNRISIKKWEILVSDLLPSMVSDVKPHLHNQPCSFLACDAQRIPIKNNVVDVIIANHMLYNVSDGPRVFSEIRRVLKPGGYVFITTSSSDHLKELRELVRMSCPKVRFKTCDLTSWFDLENGTSQLSDWFSQINIRHYKDSLLITRAESFITYVLFCLDTKFTKKELEKITQFIKQNIKSHGAIQISKNSGMFIARK